MKNDEIVKLLKDGSIALENRFWMTSILVDALKPLGLISDAEQLNFYGPFKQAIFGKCTDPAPSILNYAHYKKWKNWHEQSEQDDMSTEDAQQKYMEIAFEIFERIQNNVKVIEVFGEFTPEILQQKSAAKKGEFAAQVKQREEQAKIDKKSAAEREQRTNQADETPKGFFTSFGRTVVAMVRGESQQVSSEKRLAAKGSSQPEESPKGESRVILDEHAGTFDKIPEREGSGKGSGARV